MSFQEVCGSVKYVKYNECEPGEVLAEGLFKETREGKYGDEYIITGDGDTTVLNEAGHLRFLLQHVNHGDLVKIIYLKQETLDKGPYAGKSVHRFKLLVDKDAPKSLTEVPY